jgi:hypothetical protein
VQGAEELKTFQYSMRLNLELQQVIPEPQAIS